MKVTSFTNDGRPFVTSWGVLSISKPEEWKDDPIDATHWILHHKDGTTSFVLGLNITVEEEPS
jgi:hypothetical protein